MNKAPQIKVSYDDIADVLYLTSARIVHTKNREDEAGLVLRYDLETHKPVGVTIVDYKEYWIPRKQHLVERLSTFFGITKEDATRVIRSAH